MRNLFFVSISILSSTFATCQTLKMETIMKGDAFIGVQPFDPRWALEGDKIYFEWNPNNDIGSSTYYWKKGMLKPEIAPAPEVVFSKLNFKRSKNLETAYYIQKGVLFAYTIKTKSIKKIYQSSLPISNLQLGYQEGTLFFEQNENLFKYNTIEGSLVQISNFKQGKATEKNADKKDSFLKDNKPNCSNL
jgi:hypothetical protein